MKIKLTLEIELHEAVADGADDGMLEWLENDVLSKENLYIHSNEIGDDIGKVESVKVEYIEPLAIKI